MSENDSLFTLPFTVIEQLGTRSELSPERYKPSYISRILNRAIAPEFHNPQARFLRGHFFIEPPERFSTLNSGSRITFNSGDKQVVLEGMSYPGSTHGKELFDQLDEKVSNIDVKSLNEEQLSIVAAFLTICSVTIHPFRDSNGRGAVGLADVFLRSNTGTTFDYEKLVEHNQTLVNLLVIGSLSLLPPSHNPEICAMQMAVEDKYLEIKIPNMQNASVEEVSAFLKDFSDTITAFIRTFDVAQATEKPARIFDPNYSIHKLAALFREVHKPIDSQERVKQIQANIKAIFQAEQALQSRTAETPPTEADK